MKAIDVKVQFDGVVTVEVPNYLSKEDAEKLARMWALSRIVATTDNPDAPDEGAFEDYTDECSNSALRTAEIDWNECVASSLGGVWT
jgi:hypothetical protein